jgi:hypothetical protein
MTLHIDRLTIRLPSEFAHRAKTIARHTADALAGQTISIGPVENVRVKVRGISHFQSDGEIAQYISREISNTCGSIKQ